MATTHKKLATGYISSSGALGSSNTAYSPSSGTLGMVKTLIIFNGEAATETVKVYYGDISSASADEELQVLEVEIDSKDTFEWNYSHMLPVEGGTDKVYISTSSNSTGKAVYHILGAEES